MGRNRTLRWIGVVFASLIGLVTATSTGAPLAAAAIALMAGAIAISFLWAPAPAEVIDEEAEEESAPAPFLPELADVVDAVEEPVLIVRERRILLANEAAEAVLGKHIAGVDIRLAIRHPAAAERLISDRPEHAKVDLVGLGELDRRWEMVVSPLPDGSRLVRLADRSEVHASEQMRIDFVANASHELRTPLATLIGFSETLLDDTAAEDPKTRKRFLTIISDEARRMQQLVEDLISLSRIEAERFSVPREPVHLLPLVQEVRTACVQLMATKQSTVSVRSSTDDPVVPGDRSQLLQLLQNLVVNALKYGRPGTEVAIAFEDAGPHMLRLSVTDHGDGIPPEHLPRLTERFYRVDPGRSRSMGGTGLGLAIVKHIVGRHRGRLDIRSKVGEGTTVSVDLPSLS